GGRRIGEDLRHNRALSDGNVELLGQLAIDRLDSHAEVRSGDAPFFDQLISDPSGKVDRHGKADAVITTRAGGNRRIYPDDLTRKIDQRSAAVAGVDGRVRLQKIFTFRQAGAAPFGADDSGGDCCIQAKRAADRQDPVSDFESVTVPQ